MTRLFSHTMFLVLVLAGFVSSHEEPPKSSADLADQDRIRLRFSAAKVKTETGRKTQYSADGKVTGSYVYSRNQYDRDGRQLRAIVYDSTGKALGNLEHVYDMEHRLVDQIDCDGDTSCVRTIFVYRPNHLMALAVDLTPEGSPLAQLSYSYPHGDTLVHLVKQDSLKKVLYTLDYVFHPNRIIGYVVRASKRGPDGKVMLRTEQSGDSRGLVEKRVIGYDGKTTVLYKYTRREDGQLQKMIRVGADGRPDQETVWEFGANALPVSQKTMDSSGHVLSSIEYQYEYW